MVSKVLIGMFFCRVLLNESCASFDLVNAVTKGVIGAALESRRHVYARSRKLTLNSAWSNCLPLNCKTNCKMP